MASMLIWVALVAILFIGWQEFEGLGRGILGLGIACIAGAAGLLLAGDSEPGDSSSDSWDGGDGDA